MLGEERAGSRQSDMLRQSPIHDNRRAIARQCPTATNLPLSSRVDAVPETLHYKKFTVLSILEHWHDDHIV